MRYETRICQSNYNDARCFLPVFMKHTLCAFPYIPENVFHKRGKPMAIRFLVYAIANAFLWGSYQYTIFHTFQGKRIFHLNSQPQTLVHQLISGISAQDLALFHQHLIFQLWWTFWDFLWDLIFQRRSPFHHFPYFQSLNFPPI